jgi:hypothetical protein
MKKPIIVLAAALLLVIGAAIAYASIPGPDGVIHGCYKTSNPAQGALIAIDSAASCPSGYTALNWNQTGPQGPAGPQGAPGISGYETVQANGTYPSGYVQDMINIEVTCPTGKHVLGGGGALQARNPTDYSLVYSQPFGDPSNGWNMQWIGPSTIATSDIHVTGYAICAYTN